MLTAVMNGDGDFALMLRGTIGSADLVYFSDVLDQASRESGRSVLVDLSGVESWSLLAQAIVLSAARRVGSRGDRMILRNASEDLRQESARMDVFGRVDTTP